MHRPILLTSVDYFVNFYLSNTTLVLILFKDSSYIDNKYKLCILIIEQCFIQNLFVGIFTYLIFNEKDATLQYLNFYFI